jgi:hypothetical protein
LLLINMVETSLLSWRSFITSSMEWTVINQRSLITFLGVVVIVLTITALAFSKNQRDVLLGRLHTHRRRFSGASTPPRSFSPSKASPDTKESLPPTPPDYFKTFPPSRRLVLPELAGNTTPLNREMPIGEEPSPQTLLDNPLPTTRSYDLENDVPKYTPTGFSTAEINAMGDFPAYDILSGVPLPQPYANFDPAKALPRPYRPFRWAYHQTMCKSRLFCLSW